MWNRWWRKSERRDIVRNRILRWVPASLVMILIFSFSAADGDDSGSTSGVIVEQILKIVEGNRPMAPEKREEMFDRLQFVVRKGAHMTEYAILALALLLAFSQYWRPVWPLAWRGELACFLYACTDELHQRLVPGRSGRFQDVLIDSAGALAGILVGIGILSYIRKKHGNTVGRVRTP